MSRIICVKFGLSGVEHSVHHYEILIHLFNQCFAEDFNTRLIKGEDEPVYLPAHELQSYHAVFFANGFFSSALHECAHWLIAGRERRMLVDFGYWYAPDGRTQEQQTLFQSVEVKPQAMEWILSVSCGHPFRISIDNLNGMESDTERFKQAIHQQVIKYCKNGLTPRAQRFRGALCTYFQTSPHLKAEDFVLAQLR